MGDRVAAPGADLLCDLVGGTAGDALPRGVRAEVVDHDARALGGEGQRVGAAEAASGTGDDGDAIGADSGHG